MEAEVEIDLESYVVKQYELIVPITVYAELVTPNMLKWISVWCRGKIAEDGAGILVPTLSGIKLAPMGSYVVKRMTGDFQVLDRIPFENKYVLVNMSGPR